MELTDAQLIAQYHSGDTLSLDMIIARHTPRLHYFVARLVGIHNADDVTQDVWVKVWRYSRRFDPKKNFKAWLFSIAKNTAYDYLRKKQPLVFSSLQSGDDDVPFEDVIADERKSAFETVASQELIAALDKALDIFPLQTRMVFDMHYKEGLSLVEIAEVTGTPINTIKSRHLRGLKALREYLEKSPR
jgi:RNA polymerase sigma-70 factor (ECF subfamily)